MALERLRFLLSVASSQNPSGLKEAEAELRSMEIQPQFHIALLVSSNRNGVNEIMT